MKKAEIKELYILCNKDYNIENNYDIPNEMRYGNYWKVFDSTLDVGNIEELEKTFNLKLPIDYCNYILAASHMFNRLVGNFNNFLFEDNVDIILEIPPQPYKDELKYIREMLNENRLIVELGYLPLGIFDDSGYLCMDLQNKNQIVWLPFDFCIGLTLRKEFEKEQVLIFNNLDEYIKCFFGHETHNIEES